MHPDVAAVICDLAPNVPTSVLEIGATSGSTLLTRSPFASAERRVGVDLNEWHHPEIETYAANAHDLSFLEADQFDCLICNAVLEHDPRFWETLTELRRVAAPGATLVVGVPGYSERVERRAWLERLGIESIAAPLTAPSNDPGDTGKSQKETSSQSLIGRIYDYLPTVLQQTIAATYQDLSRRDAPVAKTYGIHAAPSDYYRFSPMAMQEVLLKGLHDTEVRDILSPPRLIGRGRYPNDPSQ